MRIITLLVSIAVPCLIMIATQHFESKKFNKQQYESNANFDKQLDEEKLIHKVTLEQQKNDSRINIMPYLFLLKSKIWFHFDSNESDRVIIDMSFINKGKGTAVNVQCKYINDDKYGDASIIAKSIAYRYFCYTPFDWQCNVVMTNEIITMKAMFNKNNILNDNLSKIYTDQFEFTIKYNDVSENLYEQKFSVQYQFEKNEIKQLLINSFNPVLVIPNS